MFDYYGNMMGGATWLWMLPMMLLFWGAIFAFVIYALKSFGAKPAGDSALDTLRTRLASGTISQEEFEKTRQLLGR